MEHQGVPLSPVGCTSLIHVQIMTVHGVSTRVTFMGLLPAQQGRDPGFGVIAGDPG